MPVTACVYNHNPIFASYLNGCALGCTSAKDGDADYPRTYSYDFAARYLTTGFPVFTTSDLLQERHYPISAYAYCSNNPINCSDPTGLDWVEVNNSLLTRSDFVGTNLLPVNTMSQVQRYSYRPTNFFVEEVLA